MFFVAKQKYYALYFKQMQQINYWVFKVTLRKRTTVGRTSMKINKHFLLE